MKFLLAATLLVFGCLLMAAFLLGVSALDQDLPFGLNAGVAIPNPVADRAGGGRGVAAGVDGAGGRGAAELFGLAQCGVAGADGFRAAGGAGQLGAVATGAGQADARGMRV